MSQYLFTLLVAIHWSAAIVSALVLYVIGYDSALAPNPSHAFSMRVWLAIIATIVLIFSISGIVALAQRGMP